MLPRFTSLTFIYLFLISIVASDLFIIASKIRNLVVHFVLFTITIIAFYVVHKLGYGEAAKRVALIAFLGILLIKISDWLGL